LSTNPIPFCVKPNDRFIVFLNVEPISLVLLKALIASRKRVLNVALFANSTQTTNADIMC